MMKIDAFDVSLSSSRRHVETIQTSVEESFRFVELVDEKIARFREAAAFTDVGLTALQTESQWVETTVFKGEPAVTAKDSFLQELANMREIMDSILEAYRATAFEDSDAGSFRISRVSQVFTQRTFEYQRIETQTYSEQEETTFSAGGTVKTADGEEIAFSLDLNMERSFYRETSFTETIEGFALIDPLVVYTDATAPQLSGTSFQFDLDADGSEEEIRPPVRGSGFLALDRNEDGIINDGSELFGPGTGDGFGELAAFDSDGNGWIDENDAVFDDLTLWGEDGEGSMHLTRIRDAGIGAIYLAAVDTPFDVTDANNEPAAHVKKSSIALNEDGGVSTVQEMDWFV